MRRSWAPIVVIISTWICSACTSESVPPRTGRGPSVSMPDGPADDGSPDPDPGPDPAGGSCESDVVSAPTTAACAAATDTCVQACTTEDCYYACLDMDPDPDGCSDCVDDAFISCINSRGCQSAWDAMLCCTDQNCGATVTEAACMTACGSEITAFNTCLDGAAAGCEDDSVCFP